MLNLPLWHWPIQLFDLHSPSSTDVSVLLLNQLILREQRGMCSDYRVFIKIFNLSFILFLSISLARYTLATLCLLLNTVGLRYNELLYNEVLGVTNDFLYPVIVKYMKRTSILAVPWPFVILRFHCNIRTCEQGSWPHGKII